MVPHVLKSVRAREPMPEAPPEVDPAQAVSTEWSKLRGYARHALERAQTTIAENDALLADNDALRREVDRLTALNAELIRDNRLIRSYATSVRTRLTMIREGIEAAERDALQDAQAVADTPEPSPPASQQAQARGEAVSMPFVSWGRGDGGI